MLSHPDYLVVGAGLTGATIARMLHDAGYRVLVIERRIHMGGNVYDSTHASGIRFHNYGPHYFRTSSPRIWAFVTRFAEFYPFEARIKSAVNNELVAWPLGKSYIEQRIGNYTLPSRDTPPANFEEAALSLMPEVVYNTFVKPYNEKQWGVAAHSLDADLCRRFDVRADDDDRLTPKALHQGLPKQGYSAFVEALLEAIPVLLNVDFDATVTAFKPRYTTFFTGPIDAYFGYDYGHLSYRAQQRTHTYLPDVQFSQPCVQVNNPLHEQGAHIRTIEWKHLMPEPFAERIKGTLLTTETPYTPSDPEDYEYPFPDQANQALYKRYRERADSLDNIVFCGRLGEYRYLDMDQAIARAQTLVAKELEKVPR